MQYIDYVILRLVMQYIRLHHVGISNYFIGKT